jgi:hypothetical protein
VSFEDAFVRKEIEEKKRLGRLAPTADEVSLYEVAIVWMIHFDPSLPYNDVAGCTQPTGVGQAI